MLDIILSYIFTILISYGIDFLTLKEVIKVVFDNGYKIEITYDSELYESLNKASKSTRIIKFIPLINIIDSLMIYVNIKNTQNYIIDKLSIYNMIEEMNNDEKEKYNKKPNFFTGLTIAIDSKKNSKNLSVTRLKDGSLVYSKYVNDEICIDTTGPIAELKNEEQIKLILEEIQNTNENSKLKDMFIEKEIITKKSKLILKLENLKNELKAHIEEIEKETQNEDINNNQKIKKL